MNPTTAKYAYQLNLGDTVCLNGVHANVEAVTMAGVDKVVIHTSKGGYIFNDETVIIVHN